MERKETSKLILVDIHISRMYSDVVFYLFEHHIERGCENILSLSSTSGIIMMALCHHGSSTGEKRVVSINITTIIITIID